MFISWLQPGPESTPTTTLPVGSAVASSGPDAVVSIVVGIVLALLSIAVQVRPLKWERVNLGIATLCYVGIAELALWFFWPALFPGVGFVPVIAGVAGAILIDRRSPKIDEEDRGVVVLGAAWGRDGLPYRDVTPVVRGAVDRKPRTLRIRACNDDLVGGISGDPALAIEKVLKIQWSRDGKAQREARFREGDTARLPLPRDYVPCDLPAVAPTYQPAGYAPHMSFGDLQTSSLGTATPRQPENPAPQVAPEGHITHLRATAEAMGKAVRAGDVAGGRDRRTAALLAHVAELSEPLMAWDAAVRAVLEARQTYRRLVNQVIDELDEGVYARAAVGEAIRSTVDSLLVEATDFQKPRFDDEGRQVFWALRLWWDEADPASPVQWSKPNLMPVLVHGSESAEERQERIQTLQRAFKWVYHSPEVAAIPQSEDAKADAMEAVVPVLDSCATRFDLMYVRPDCPDCP